MDVFDRRIDPADDVQLQKIPKKPVGNIQQIGKQLLIVRRSLPEKGFGVLDLSLPSFCASHFRTPKGLPPSVKPKSGKRSQANSKSDERSAAHGLDIGSGKFVRFPEGVARLS